MLERKIHHGVAFALGIFLARTLGLPGLQLAFKDLDRLPIFSLQNLLVLYLGVIDVDDPHVGHRVHQDQVLVGVELHAGPPIVLGQVWDQMLQLDRLEFTSVRAENKDLVERSALAHHYDLLLHKNGCKIVKKGVSYRLGRHFWPGSS